MRDSLTEGVKNCNIFVYFDKMHVNCCKMCVVCNKVKLSQIPLMLPEFTHLIFTTINSHLSLLT
jgi:hypothetical protein